MVSETIDRKETTTCTHPHTHKISRMSNNEVLIVIAASSLWLLFVAVYLLSPTLAIIAWTVCLLLIKIKDLLDVHATILLFAQTDVAEKEAALKTKRVLQAQMAGDAKKALKEKRVLKTKKARDAKKAYRDDDN